MDDILSVGIALHKARQVEAASGNERAHVAFTAHTHTVLAHSLHTDAGQHVTFVPRVIAGFRLSVVAGPIVDFLLCVTGLAWGRCGNGQIRPRLTVVIVRVRPPASNQTGNHFELVEMFFVYPIRRGVPLNGVISR